ncbi:hypothetical protein GCM10011354_36050 [Egicoccus halophilus]|uniref:Uncharacterized protein n=1 Tax=Egicoccus halophilus TaxID=1670830 RepID=A0A8J3ADP4_9ACTN|nr:hypothetical protein GCM10011354_36050 [Egicoccus halophilus]
METWTGNVDDYGTDVHLHATGIYPDRPADDLPDQTVAISLSDPPNSIDVHVDDKFTVRDDADYSLTVRTTRIETGILFNWDDLRTDEIYTFDGYFSPEEFEDHFDCRRRRNLSSGT